MSKASIEVRPISWAKLREEALVNQSRALDIESAYDDGRQDASAKLFWLGYGVGSVLTGLFVLFVTSAF